MIDVDHLALVKSINEFAGREVSYTELRFLFMHFGGKRSKLPDLLERFVRVYPQQLECCNRVGEGRQLQVWVRVRLPSSVGDI